uniref:hypothetical protein n=1 Tax=Candidatus Nitrotoga sp. BS TaxID=2890408 RepID=UPI001EF3C1C2|nr:hypothetical protein [Candidatus Nitrotoga sp. BS]
MGKEDSRIQASGDSFMPGEFFPIVKSNRVAAVAVRFKQGLDDGRYPVGMFAFDQPSLCCDSTTVPATILSAPKHAPSSSCPA